MIVGLVILYSGNDRSITIVRSCVNGDITSNAVCGNRERFILAEVHPIISTAVIFGGINEIRIRNFLAKNRLQTHHIGRFFVA